jgi:hypothetical protein
VRQSAGNQDPKQQSGRFRDYGSDRGTGNSKVERQHQQHGRGHIDEVDGDLDAEREPGAACPISQPRMTKLQNTSGADQIRIMK